jgi:hypothetical protein
MPDTECPIKSNPPSVGGQIDARVGNDARQHLRYTFTPVMDTSIPYAACALLELSRQAVTDPIMDQTLPCRNCARVLRLQSTM